jgi:hypothetical protein
MARLSVDSALWVSVLTWRGVARLILDAATQVSGSTRRCGSQCRHCVAGLSLNAPSQVSVSTRHCHALNEKHLRVIRFNCAGQQSNRTGNKDNVPEQGHRSTPLREVSTGESLAGVRSTPNWRDDSLQAQTSTRPGPRGEEMLGLDPSARGKRKLTSQPKAASSKRPQEKVHSERQREAPVPPPRPAVEQNPP